MTVTHMENLGRSGASSPMTVRQSRDALANYCAARWPVGRRKAVEREWGLSPDGPWPMRWITSDDPRPPEPPAPPALGL